MWLVRLGFLQLRVKRTWRSSGSTTKASVRDSTTAVGEAGWSKARTFLATAAVRGDLSITWESSGKKVQRLLARRGWLPGGGREGPRLDSRYTCIVSLAS